MRSPDLIRANRQIPALRARRCFIFIASAAQASFQKFAKRSTPPSRPIRYHAGMRRYETRARAQRLPPATRSIPRAARRFRATARTALPALRPAAQALPALPVLIEPETGPYLDYSRSFTPGGGVLIVYKDLDLRLRYTLWRIVAWTIFTGSEARLLLDHSPLQSQWINIACLLAIAALNWLIVRKPIELYRSVEIRPDCLVLDGGDVFWRSKMENGWPEFQPDDDGNQILSGIYGTRLVEYLTARRFDDNDSMPEVFAAHWQQAVEQLWENAT
jgi:hypothetical protein